MNLSFSYTTDEFVHTWSIFLSNLKTKSFKATLHYDGFEWKLDVNGHISGICLTEDIFDFSNPAACMVVGFTLLKNMIKREIEDMNYLDQKTKTLVWKELRLQCTT
jgi:hypothetical protein